MVELLPCPFCGGARGRPMLDEIAEDHGGGWRVGCYGCGIFTAIPCTKEDAIAAWNRRPTQPVTQDAVIKALEMTRDHLTDAMTAAANAGFIAGATNDTLLECKSREQYLRLKPWLDAVKAALAQAVAGEREACAKVAESLTMANATTN